MRGPLALLLVLHLAIPAAAAPVAPPPSPPPSPPRTEDRLGPVLATLGGAELVMFSPPRPPAAPMVQLAAHVRTPASRMRALLIDPGTYRRAVPAFVRADVLSRAHLPEGDALYLAWELEVPLWNLNGKLWLRPHHGAGRDGGDLVNGVTLELIEGDLAPGTFLLEALDADDGAGCVLSILSVASLSKANWMTKRLAKRDPRAEPAMAATAAYVLLRALVLEAERMGPPPPTRRPTATMSAPSVRDLDGTRLARMAAQLDAADKRVLAAVRSRPDGRLDHVEVAMRLPLAPDLAAARIAEVARWRSLPGWSDTTIKRGSGPPVWEVDSSFPFVDFDAEWEIASQTPAFRAFARPGSDWVGPVMGWDVLPGPTPATSVAVLSLHPRIDSTGYVSRKLIEAEPLLEHGLALGLAYVDAVSLAGALH